MNHKRIINQLERMYESGKVNMFDVLAVPEYLFKKKQYDSFNAITRNGKLDGEKYSHWLSQTKYYDELNQEADKIVKNQRFWK